MRKRNDSCVSLRRSASRQHIRSAEDDSNSNLTRCDLLCVVRIWLVLASRMRLDAHPLYFLAAFPSLNSHGMTSEQIFDSNWPWTADVRMAARLAAAHGCCPRARGFHKSGLPVNSMPLSYKTRPLGRCLWEATILEHPTLLVSSIQLDTMPLARLSISLTELSPHTSIPD